MKKILLLIIVLAAIIVGVPYYYGYQAEQTYRGYVDLFNKNSAMPGKIIAYDRGIWSSTATTEVPLGLLTVKFQHKIFHGPVIIDTSAEKPNGLQFAMAVIRSAPDLSETQYNEVHKAFGDLDPLSWKSVIALNGSLETFVHSPAIDYKTDTGALISWKGLQGQLSIDKDHKTIKGNFTFPGLSVNSQTFNGEIQGLNFQVDQKRSNLDLWLGKALLGIDKILINQQDKKIEVSSLKFDGEVENQNQNQLLDIMWTMDLTQAVTPLGIYGPIDVLIKLLNMDPEALKLLKDVHPNQIGNQEIPKFIIKKFLLKSPTLVIENTRLTLPEGNVTINAKLSVGGGNIPDNFDDSIYMSTLDGNLAVELPKEIFEKGFRQVIFQNVTKDPEYNSMTSDQQKAEIDRQLTQKLEKFKSNGLLNEQGNSYLIKFSVVKGKIMANDKEVPISDLN